MMRHLGLVLATLALLAMAAAVIAVWRLSAMRAKPQVVARPPIEVAPAPQPAPAARLSTIIDLPGDPALVRRASQKAPRPLTLAVPAQLDAGAPRSEEEVFYVNEPLTPAGGGYLGKFADNGSQVDSLNAELAMNSGQGAAEDMGDDDDGGDLTPDNVEPIAPLTGANTQQLDAVPGGDNGQAQIRQVTLKPTIAQKISELLIESGFEPQSARDAEDAARRIYKIQSLRAGSVGLAIGAVDPSGAYRVAQLAIFQDGEYAGTVAKTETGQFAEAAEPTIPPGLLDDSDLAPAGTRFNLADGVYSAGLRSAVPEPVIREAVHLMSRIADLGAPLSTGVTLRLLYARTPRSKGQASRVIYAGLSGGGASADCYAFELNDGSYRCFLKEDAEPPPLPPVPPPEPYTPSAPAVTGGGVPLPPERHRQAVSGGGGGGALADSGANAVGGLLPPIRGAPITSLFGMRFHPILHITRLHAGIDFGAHVGSLVRAAADGVVESAGEARGYGSRVVLKHNGYETTYNHLSEIRVDVGTRVRVGEVIALSGNSGLSTGPHLHFEYRVDGVPQDPLPHMGREVQARPSYASPAVSYTQERLPSAASSSAAPPGPYIPLPPTIFRPPPPDPAILAAFAAAKADIDAALAVADR
jgi:murein DD-endopeptidase MepM/ murein hydrolase activator NlpD